MTAQLERHLLSVAWGDMPENDFREFVESVREHGVADPLIVLLDGKVLDGWHRYRAAVEVGIELELVRREFLGDDPVGYVIRRNGDRRHLTAGQRAICVAKCYEWARLGSNQWEGVTSRYTLKEKNSDGASANQHPDKVRSQEGVGEVGAERGATGPVRPADEWHGPATTRSAVGQRQETGPTAEGLAAGSQEPLTARLLAEKANTTRKTAEEAKAIIRAGLADAVLDHEMSFDAAVRQARGGETDKPKPLTRTEKLEALVDTLRMEVEEKAARIEELDQRLAFMERESSPVEAVREEMFNRYREQIRVLKGSVGEWQTKYNDVLTENKGLRAVLKRVGGNVKETPRQEATAPCPVYQAPAEGHHSREMEPEEVDTPEYVDDPDGWEAESREDIGDDLATDVGTYEKAQWLDGFRVGEYVVTEQGEHGVIQDMEEGRLLVRLDYGLGELVAMESGQVSHEDVHV